MIRGFDLSASTFWPFGIFFAGSTYVDLLGIKNHSIHLQLDIRQ